jgi:hypothetical protein
MGKIPLRLDDFERMIFRLGYHPAAESELNQEIDPYNSSKIFVNIRSLKNIVRNFGFQEESIIRARYFNNKYWGTFYTIKNIPPVDNFKEEMIALGFHLVGELELNEETDFRNTQRVYPNISKLTLLIKHFGFQEDIVSRIKFIDNKHQTTVYIVE